jgi:hypothetical protein
VLAVSALAGMRAVVAADLTLGIETDPHDGRGRWRWPASSRWWLWSCAISPAPTRCARR